MKSILTILFALVALTGQAKGKTVVWEQPTTEFGNSYGDGFFILALDITKVELKDDETVVYITAQERSDYPEYSFQFAGDTYLKVDDKRYPLVKTEGIEVNTFVQTNKDNRRDMVFHFQPLPQDTKAFDFIEGDGERAFQFRGVKPVEERWKDLLPSYWRNDKGEWTIAFLFDRAIYDCKFWKYEMYHIDSKTGEGKFVLSNGNDKLTVMVGKDKKGSRTIQIGDKKATYTMITSRFMPDYPTKDTRAEFVNTNYKTDTITVVGWLKDMPDEFKNLKTFNFGYNDPFTDEQVDVNAALDEDGRFTVKIPALNSMEFRCDWRRCFLRTMLEPGKTYFLLYDFQEGRRYFMGDDCRLQNELLRFPPDYKSIRFYTTLQTANTATQEDFDRYQNSVDSLLTSSLAATDLLCQQHPTLSTRFQLYQKGYTLFQQARDYSMARFRMQGARLPEKGRQYAHDMFWRKLPQPVTLYSDIIYFINNFIQEAENTLPDKFSYSVLDHLTEFASNDEELALLNRWKEWINDANAKVMAAETVEEKQKIAEELNTNNADMIKQVDKILNGSKAMKTIRGKGAIADMQKRRKVLDSLQAEPFVKDVFLAQIPYSQIDHMHTALPAEVFDTLKAMVSNPEYIQQVEELNAHYLAIENREFDKLVIKSSDNLADISEGEALLKKLIEPYKGKFVLLDIWGTWCGPCKEALSHSTEEYARLNGFDIQYLYLANESPQQSWENVIKKYNVSGPNVAHYNLPKEQQRAIEQYLKVNAFPTYKLFNRNGDLLDLNVDPRNLEALAQLLEQMK